MDTVAERSILLTNVDKSPVRIIKVSSIIQKSFSLLLFNIATIQYWTTLSGALNNRGAKCLYFEDTVTTVCHTDAYFLKYCINIYLYINFISPCFQFIF